MDKDGYTRREFLETSLKLGVATLTGGAILETLLPQLFAQDKKKTELFVVKNGEPAQLVRKVIQLMGGISRFVKKGDIVVVKPNFSFNRKPEYAATTNPDVVKEVVKLCLEAGAKKVKVFDYTVDRDTLCARTTGIKKAVEQVGGTFEYVLKRKFVKKKIKDALALDSWEFYKDALDADCLINIPIAKVHGLTRLTLILKNWMGLIGGKRGKIHKNIYKKLIDIHRVFKQNAKLYIIDAYRILLKDGPKGGKLENVKTTKTIIASTDPVICEAYAATLFGKKPHRIKMIRTAHKYGEGEIDLKKAKIKEVDLKK
jgi:uncharacterized protein (DUF362 family)